MGRFEKPGILNKTPSNSSGSNSIKKSNNSLSPTRARVSESPARKPLHVMTMNSALKRSQSTSKQDCLKEPATKLASGKTSMTKSASLTHKLSVYSRTHMLQEFELVFKEF